MNSRGTTHICEHCRKPLQDWRCVVWLMTGKHPRTTPKTRTGKLLP